MELKYPYNQEAEAGIVAGLIAKPEKFEEIIQILNPDDFYDNRFREIYLAMANIFGQGKAIDLVTLDDLLRTSSTLVSSVDLAHLAGSYVSASQLDAYVRIVKEKSVLRSYIKISVGTIEKAKNGDQTLEVLNSSLQQLQDIVDSSVSVKEKDGGLVHVKDRQSEALDILKHDKSVIGLGTGIGPLDDIMGGMDKEELIIIGGQTGHGKSMLMQRIALNSALKKEPILYLSLEMSIPQQIARFYSMAREELPDTVETISKLPIYFYGGKDTMSLGLLNRLLRIAKEKYGIKAVFIDHIHYFSQDIDNVTSEVGLIVRTLKEYARRYELPIIAISTLRKLQGKGMPEIDDLKDSVMIGYDADIIMMIYRDIEGENKPANELVVKVKKNRPRGRIGSVKLEITDNYNLVLYQKNDPPLDTSRKDLYN